MPPDGDDAVPVSTICVTICGAAVELAMVADGVTTVRYGLTFVAHEKPIAGEVPIAGLSMKTLNINSRSFG